MVPGGGDTADTGGGIPPGRGDTARGAERVGRYYAVLQSQMGGFSGLCPFQPVPPPFWKNSGRGTSRRLFLGDSGRGRLNFRQISGVTERDIFKRMEEAEVEGPKDSVTREPLVPRTGGMRGMGGMMGGMGGMMMLIPDLSKTRGLTNPGSLSRG